MIILNDCRKRIFGWRGFQFLVSCTGGIGDTIAALCAVHEIKKRGGVVAVAMRSWDMSLKGIQLPDADFVFEAHRDMMSPYPYLKDINGVEYASECDYIIDLSVHPGKVPKYVLLPGNRTYGHYNYRYSRCGIYPEWVSYPKFNISFSIDQFEKCGRILEKVLDKYEYVCLTHFWSSDFRKTVDYALARRICEYLTVSHNTGVINFFYSGMKSRMEYPIYLPGVVNLDLSKDIHPFETIPLATSSDIVVCADSFLGHVSLVTKRNFICLSGYCPQWFLYDNYADVKFVNYKNNNGDYPIRELDYRWFNERVAEILSR